MVSDRLYGPTHYCRGMIMHHAPHEQFGQYPNALTLLDRFETNDAPRAHIDPVRTTDDLLALAALTVKRPLQPETIVVGLDHRSCGSFLIAVTDTTRADHVLEVVRLVRSALDADDAPETSAIALISVRPGTDARPNDLRHRRAMERIMQPFALTDWLVIGDRVTLISADDARQAGVAAPIPEGVATLLGSTPARHRRR